MKKAKKKNLIEKVKNNYFVLQKPFVLETFCIMLLR